MSDLMEYTFICDGITIASMTHKNLRWSTDYIGNVLRIEGITYRVTDVKDDVILLREDRLVRR